jgi:4-amino-4-deoxy-L-arabinose transferase-like glycosyltransferase
MTSPARAVSFPAESSAFRWAAFITVAVTALRLVGLRYSEVDLFIDESQYWSWSRDLALGYFSKPPLLAWLIAAAEYVCGSAESCVRAPAPLLYLATTLVAYAIGRALYDARTGFWTAMLTLLGTGTVFSARIISTDVPLVFFWAVALLAYAHLIQQAGWRWAVLLGLAIGGGLLAKYAMIYFLAGMLVAAVLEKEARTVLVSADLWLALGVAVVTVSPNLLWNADNGFLTLRHAGANVVGERIELSVIRPLEFLAAQFAVFGPVVFGVAIAAMARMGSKKLRPADRILLAFAIPPLAVVTVTAIGVHAYANWAAASFVSLAVLAAAVLVRGNYGVLLWGSLALGALMQLVLVGGDAFATRIRLPLTASNPYERTLGWKAYGQAVGELARKIDAPTIASDLRADVASLLYYRRGQPEQILAWSTSELPNFELTRGLTAAARQPILFVSQCPFAERLEKSYAKVVPLGIVFPEAAVRRPFAAFRLEDPRGPIAPLAPCKPK